MTARDAAIWQAYFELEPRGDDRADIHAAFIAHKILWSQLGTKAPSIVEVYEDLTALWADDGALMKLARRRKAKKDEAIVKKIRALADHAKRIAQHAKHRDVIG